jgi:hypothetical protein
MENLGYKNYENANVTIWMLDKDVEKWGIELKMKTP